jgi:hypothetical protein
MNVNTWDATPVYDEVITAPSPSRPLRVFDDGSDVYNLWFELERDKFWCGRDRADAHDTRLQVPNSGVSEETLRRDLTGLQDVTDQH